MTAGDQGFSLISVHEDEEELVIHAGSGKTAAGSDAPVTAPEDGQAAVHAQEPASTAEDAATPAEPAVSPRQEALRRKAEELAQAEEGLEDPHTFSRTRTYVLLALVLLVVAFAVYTFAMHA